MKYQIIPVTHFQQNATVLWCEKTKEAAIVDPGGDAERLIREIEALGVKLTKVILTHGHLDHVGAAPQVAAHFGVKIIGPHRDDQFLFESLPEQSQMFGFALMSPFLPDEWLADGDTFKIGEETVSVLHCPGHTPGHVVFYMPDSQLASVGDVLFAGSIGRTDFPRGDFQTLMTSIKTKLFALNDDVQFIPGHGPMSTFGQEKRTNPFVGINA